MKHRIGYNRIGRKAAHRKALIKNMVMQLYRYERIRTTKVKAQEVRRRAEKLITRAKEDSVHNRRIVAKLIQDKEILAKLFTEIAPAYADRPGGYTRILKLGYRKGDAAEMVLLELVGRDEEKTPRRRRAKASAAASPEVKEEAVKEESVSQTAVEVADDEANEVVEENEVNAEPELGANDENGAVDPESEDDPEAEATAAEGNESAEETEDKKE